MPVGGLINFRPDTLGGDEGALKYPTDVQGEPQIVRATS